MDLGNAWRPSSGANRWTKNEGAGPESHRQQISSLARICRMACRPPTSTKAGLGPVVLQTDEDPLCARKLERWPSIAAAKSRTTHGEDPRICREPDWKTWLAKYKVGAGNVFPQKVPYYLLLVGGPERIPFDFGQLLSLEYAVGLLHFDSVGRLFAVIGQPDRLRDGNAPPRPQRDAVFFRTQEKFDRATQLSALNLVKPLPTALRAGRRHGQAGGETRGFATRRVWDADATRPALAEIFARLRAATRRPSLHRVTRPGLSRT